MTLRKFMDDEVRHVTDKVIIEDMVLLKFSGQWHIDVVEMANKTSSPIKDSASALENFEDHERKFEIQKKNGHRKKT